MIKASHGIRHGQSITKVIWASSGGAHCQQDGTAPPISAVLLQDRSWQRARFVKQWHEEDSQCTVSLKQAVSDICNIAKAGRASSPQDSQLGDSSLGHTCSPITKSGQEMQALPLQLLLQCQVH